MSTEPKVGDLVYYPRKDPETARVFEITKIHVATFDVKMSLESTGLLRLPPSRYVFKDQVVPMNAMLYLARVHAL